MTDTRSRAPGLALLLALTALFGPSPAQAAPDDPGLSITVRGVAGPILRVRPRRFNAVSVVVENRGPAERTGLLRVYRCEAPGNPSPSPALFYERSVAIPSQGRRAESIPYYVQEGERDDRLCVAFVPTDGGPAPAPTFPRVVVNDGRSQVALVVSSRPLAADGAARLFQRAVVPCPLSPQPVLVERASPATLPAHFTGFEPFDAVLLVDVDPTELDDAVAAPLLAWTAAGGDLIVATSGRGTPLAPTVAAALPVDGDPTANSGRRSSLAPLRDLAPLHDAPSADPVPVAVTTLRPGAVALATSPSGPLVARGRYGAGWVTFLAFPLDSATFARWIGVTSGAFGSALLRPSREDPEAENMTPPAPPLEELLLNVSEALETLTPPAAWIVGPLLLLYVVLVGPVAYLGFARQRRVRSVLLLTSGVATAFAAGFWALGLAHKGSEALSTQVGIVDLPNGDGPSRVEVLSGHFSTDRGLTDGSAPAGAAVGPLAGGRASNREGLVVWEGDDAHLASVTLDTWALRRFRSLRVEDQGGVRIDLTLGPGGLIQGTIENRTDLALETPLLILETGAVELDPIGPGERLALGGSPARPFRDDRTEAALLGAIVADANRSYPARFGTGIGLSSLPGRTPYGGPKGRVLATFRRRQARVPHLPGLLPALLVARAHHDPGGVRLGGVTKATVERTVVVVEAHVAPAAGRHRLLPLEPLVVRHTTGNRGAPWHANQGISGTAPVLEGNLIKPEQPGWVEWRWQLPASAEDPIAVRNLQLRLAIDPVPSAKGLVRLAGFDPTRRRWAVLADLYQLEVDETAGAYLWPPRPDPRVAALVDPTSGVLLLRLQNHGPNVTVEDVSLDVTFER